jgi:phosphatidylglycerophosphate synthase
VLLGALTPAAGLDTSGWIVGIASLSAICLLVARGLSRAGRKALGPADWVTLIRAVLVGAVAALVTSSFAHAVSVLMLVALSCIALSLDAVDGFVARHTETASGFGARFDMEVDALLILVLSGYDAWRIGSWIVVIGLARYVLLAVTWFVPWLAAPVPERYWRKVVAATQGIVLTTAAAGALPSRLVEASLAAAVALLAESFGRDIWWLGRHHRCRETSAVVRKRLAPVVRG